MAVTEAQIRDLLNRPRGLNSATITEYITIRTAEVNKKARVANLIGVTTNAPTDTLKESAIKFMVCVDCLRVLIDTIPAVVPEKEQGTSDIRFNRQLASFEKQAEAAMAVIEREAVLRSIQTAPIRRWREQQVGLCTALSRGSGY